MKLQSLAIIFIIIIIPITMVLSEYVNNRIKTETTELEYNTRLLNATYDSIKAYQLNTINNEFGDITNSKISDLEAAVTTFYNSLVNNFNFTGYNSSTMSEYVPAVAFTLYDGYYIYSPFKNTLTGVDTSKIDEDGKPTEYDDSYSEPNKITNGLKPYIYYSARYLNRSKNWDFIITYTLDNYITIMGQIGSNGSKPNYVYDYGYLYPIANKDASNDGHGIFYDSTNDSYYFDGIEFKKDDTEELKEYVGNKEYSYVKINGKKYFLDEDLGVNIDEDGKTNTKARFFYISDKGEKEYSQVKLWENCTDSEKDDFRKYYAAIKFNKSAYMYYKSAYEFSKAVLGDAIDNYKDKAGTPQGGYNLSELTPSDAIYLQEENQNNLKQAGITPLSEYGDFSIFEGDMHLANSNFNKHRKAIIRYVVETNMSPAISGFSSSAKTDFIMPKISEEDWELIQNDVCEISFLQGINIGSKKYNGYSVVANMLTKEYIDEDDIYILTTDNTYCKANDRTINDSNIKPKTTDNNYYPGIWKINFERKKYLEEGVECYYYPLSYGEGDNAKSYLGSYTSIMGSSGINEIRTTSIPDMYTYMHSKDTTLKKAYYMALGRERWCSYSVNNINYELYGNNANEPFFKDY